MRYISVFLIAIVTFISCKKENELPDLVGRSSIELLPQVEVLSVNDINCNKVSMTVRVIEENVPDSISYTSVRYEDPFGKSFWTIRMSNVELAARCGSSSTYTLSLYNRFSGNEGPRTLYTHEP